MITDTLEYMLTALSSGDKAGFLAKCSAHFAKVAEPQFEAIAAARAPQLRAGYKVVHLGDLKRREGEAAVFKIVFPSAADEVMAMISVVKEKVAGLIMK